MRIPNSPSRLMLGGDGRRTPRRSSVNAMGGLGSTNQLNPVDQGLFLTQGEIAPRTGASATRNGKHAPLLTPGHQRMINMNTS